VDENINTIKKGREALLHASRKVGLKVNTEKRNYMAVSRHQKAGQNHTLLIVITSFENAVNSKYFETTVIHKICILKEIKSGLNS
jgi:hypothetical protein